MFAPTEEALYADAGRDVVHRLDSLYEFERAPVTPDKLEPGSYFAGLIAGEHVAATEFVIGALLVSFGASATDIVLGLLLGNLLAVLSWTVVCAPIAVGTRLTADCKRWQPDVFKSNLQGYFIVSSLAVLVSHFLNGNVTPQVWTKFWWSLPFIAIGIISGLSLDRWPLLGWVALGELWLCGQLPVPAREEEEARSWPAYRPGAFTYADTRPDRDDPMLRRIEAAYYAHHRGWREDLRILLRGWWGRLAGRDRTRPEETP